MNGVAAARRPGRAAVGGLLGWLVLVCRLLRGGGPPDGPAYAGWRSRAGA